MASVKLCNVYKRYGTAEISKNINLDIQSGEFVVFVGPSGCGKSTLLRMIAGLEDISEGDLFIDDTQVNDVPPKDRSVGMVFQSYALYPHMSVAENMAFGLKLAKVNKSTIKQRVEKAANTLQLSSLLERKPKDLSGGQRQRVAIGRTIVREPKVLLFDEPLSNLDAGLRVQMRIEIAKLHKRLQATMIYVTHDQVEAMTLADKIVVLDAGFISQIGRPLELYHYPANQFVAGFIGSPQMNFIPCTIEQTHPTSVTARLTNGRPITLEVDGTQIQPGESATIGIRPEHFALPDTANVTIDGHVNVVERLGDHTLIYADMPGLSDNITIRADGNTKVYEGETYTIGLDVSRCHLFRADGSACRRLIKEPSLNF
ncbi:maltose/maltodextrin ABC transporter ATP-binding protein MalK [Zooshikella marina]|uniref:Maltose/maltodextrin ABC transporter ATP-binding protein MalK n=1 Tax=Zooshikella ganghwensis TaxID=202772 RepID=A0A4P9VMD1_9GAMM|nr:maltose/maltodextrin ABC transporter ATP-binding protein MalK [Zooshikella ganghwensis]MBU2706945.1 maltose/maltodextrin ABC transporter ATP-binding protein MalK [Zooshikella ganghwensis]RDH44548.1 maltose/maltodextrin ABC transporter ATP-binding protein MalK [Zooshikella ganghwensis]